MRWKGEGGIDFNGYFRNGVYVMVFVCLGSLVLYLFL